MRCPHHCWEKPKGQPDWSPPPPAFLFPRAAALCPAYSGMDGKGHVGAGQSLRQVTKIQLTLFRQKKTQQFTEQLRWQAGRSPSLPLTSVSLPAVAPASQHRPVSSTERKPGVSRASKSGLRGSATGPSLILGFQFRKSQRGDTPAQAPVPGLIDSGWRRVSGKNMAAFCCGPWTGHSSRRRQAVS